MNYILTQDWTEAQALDVIRSLKDYAKDNKDKAHPYANLIDTQLGISNVLGGRMPAAIIGNYLLLFTVTEVWFSPHKVFAEVLLMRMSGKAPAGFEEVPAVMETLARDCGCKVVIVGNGYLRRGLTRKYEQCGYTLSNQELIKELPNG